MALRSVYSAYFKLSAPFSKNPLKFPDFILAPNPPVLFGRIFQIICN